MFASVRVWIVMRFDRSRRIHFRRKLSFQYLEGSAVCKAEKTFPQTKEQRARRSRPTHGAPSDKGSHLPWRNLNMSILNG
jgi:hypothetical protein